MLHSTWPRLRSAAACCCPRGSRLYSWRSASRTLPDGPAHAGAAQSRTRTNSQLDRPRNQPRRPTSPLQKKLQAERQLRRRLAEGKLSWEEQLEAAAAIEGIDLQRITAGDQPDLGASDATKSAQNESESSSSTGQENPGAGWSLLRRRQRGAESELETENLREVDAGEEKPADTEQWPLLKRKEPSYGYMVPTEEPATDGKELVAATQQSLAKNENSVIERSHIMLKIDGLSTNVNPSDFYRIAENDLSKWNQSIRKIQQVRDKTTYEPTGTYNITFSTSMAAVAYAARFKRLHALVQVKTRSKSGLWRSEVPPELLQDVNATQDDLEAEIAQFSIASGAQTVTLEHKRVVIGPEARRLSNMLAGDGLGEWPPAVLLEVSPQITIERMRQAVRQHGFKARASWGMARVHAVGYSLHNQLEQLNQGVAAATAIARAEPEMDDAAAAAADGEPLESEADVAKRDEAEKQRRVQLRLRENTQRVAHHMEGAALRRFVMAFRDRSEAQRFHRMWNGRWLGGEASPPPAGRPRYFVRTQVIEF